MERRNYDDPAYKKWRKSVFARDKFRCRNPNCAGGGGPLNAHHIKTWARYPALRYVQANGITLCRTCHESVWGREEEFEQVFSQVVNPTDDAFFLMMMARYGEEG